MVFSFTKRNIDRAPPQRSNFQLIVVGVVSAVTIVGLMVLLVAGMPLDLFIMATIGLVVPIAMYYFGIKTPRSVLVCGTILLATMIPAWIVFYLRPDSPLRFFYVLPAAQVSFVASLIGWIKQRP